MSTFVSFYDLRTYEEPDQRDSEFRQLSHQEQADRVRGLMRKTTGLIFLLPPYEEEKEQQSIRDISKTIVTSASGRYFSDDAKVQAGADILEALREIPIEKIVPMFANMTSEERLKVLLFYYPAEVRTGRPYKNETQLLKPIDPVMPVFSNALFDLEESSIRNNAETGKEMYTEG